jgi:hypothetical protein
VCHELEADVTRLKVDGFAVHRPAVWFLSAGEPAGADWRAAFERLTSSAMYPNKIPCGIARPAVLAALVHPASGPKRTALYTAEPGVPPAKAITATAEVLISSTIRSGYRLGHGDAGLLLPAAADLPVGVARYDLDDFV